MNRHIIPIFLVAIALITSCKKDDITYYVKQMLDKEIDLNLDRMDKIAHDTVVYNNNPRFLLVCYFDSTECHSCATDKLHTWNNFIKKYNKKYQLDFVYIFNPSVDSQKYLRTFLTSKKEKKNIYLDTLNIFESVNTFIPKFPVYHTMLIDNGTKKIRLVGDPRRSQKIEKMLVDIISQP